MDAHRLLAPKISLREVEEKDCRLIYQWANDSTTRQLSFTSSNSIAWPEHTQWFAQKLRDRNCLFYLILLGDIPIGQLRFEKNKDTQHEAIVSIGLGAEFRGKGYGESALRLGLEKVFFGTAITIVHAYIKPENIGSLKAFERAGFVRLGQVVHNEHQAIHDICKKDQQRSNSTISVGNRATVEGE